MVVIALLAAQDTICTSHIISTSSAGNTSNTNSTNSASSNTKSTISASPSSASSTSTYGEGRYAAQRLVWSMSASKRKRQTRSLRRSPATLLWTRRPSPKS